MGISYLKENGFESVELKILESLVTNIDGHPFSLKLLAGLAKKHTAENILKDLSLFKKHQKDRIKNARFLFDKLVGGEKELLERIAVYRRPESLKAITVMSTDSIPIDFVDTLLDKSLLENDHNGNYWLHPLVQEFSYEDLKDKKGVHKLAIGYYLSLHLPEKPTKKEDIQPMIEAHYHACMAEEYDQAFKITFDNNLHEYLDLWGNYTLLIDLYSKLLPKNHFGKEILKKDKRNHGVVLGNLGSAYNELGETKKAIDYYKQALIIHREIGNRHGEGIQLGNLGLAYSRLGETKKAVDYYEQSLIIHREIGARYGEGITLGNIGDIYRHLGEIKKAIEYHNQALIIAREIGNRRGEGYQLGNLGIVYSYLGETKKAVDYYEQSLIIQREIGDRCGEGTTLGNIGLLYRRNLGETKKAIEYHNQALIIAREIGDRCGEGGALGNIGLLYHDVGETKKAIEFLKESLTIGEAIENPRLINFCREKLKELEEFNE